MGEILLCVCLVNVLPSAHPETASTQKGEAADSFDFYKKWLEEDVVYIITPEEKSVFEKLSTPDERDRFIEQFWRRREPGPGSSEFREEHYRRIAYANEHYHSGVPGWRTDRGMIYIKFGPPTGTEKYPEGGFYARKAREGGGFTSVHPFEVWFYNHIPGVEGGVEIEFVDPTRSNEYHIARDPEEKDALLNVPGAGLTMAEQFGTQSRLDRIRMRGMADPDVDRTFQPLSIRDYPLQRLERLYKLQKAPVITYKDLERAVRVRVTYDSLPLQLRLDRLQISDEFSLVPMTLFVRNRDLGYEKLVSGSYGATVDLYGQIEGLRGNVVYAFEDSIRHESTDPSQAAARDGVSVFQKRFPLRAGRYKLNLVARDKKSGNMTTVERLILVPRADKAEVTCSSALLTRLVESVPEGGTLGDPFVLGKYRVMPVEDTEFTAGDRFVQSYFEVYNLKRNQDTQQPSVKVEISLLYGGPTDDPRDPEVVFPFTPIQDEYEFSGDRLMVFKTIPFQGLLPGKHTVKFRVTDLISGKQTETGVDFVMKRL